MNTETNFIYRLCLSEPSCLRAKNVIRLRSLISRTLCCELYIWRDGGTLPDRNFGFLVREPIFTPTDARSEAPELARSTGGLEPLCRNKMQVVELSIYHNC